MIFFIFSFSHTSKVDDIVHLISRFKIRSDDASRFFRFNIIFSTFEAIASIELMKSELLFFKSSFFFQLFDNRSLKNQSEISVSDNILSHDVKGVDIEQK